MVELVGPWGGHIRCGAGGGFSVDAAKAYATQVLGKPYVVVNDDPNKGADRNFEVEMPLTRWLLLNQADVAYRIAKEDVGLKDDDAPNNTEVGRYCSVMDAELAKIEVGLPAGMKAFAHGGNELSKTESERDQNWMISFVEYFGHRNRLSVVGNYAARTPLDYIFGLERLQNCLKQWNGLLGSHEGTYDGSETYKKALANGWIGTAKAFQDRFGIPVWITEFAGSKGAFNGWEDLYRFNGGAQAWFEVLTETGDEYLIPNKLRASRFTAFDWQIGFADYHRMDLRQNIGTYNRAHPVKEFGILATTPALPSAGDTRWQLVTANANGNFVNVRSTPLAAGINNKVGEIGKNQILHIIVDPQLQVTEGSNVWRPVKLLSGIIGWASVAVFTFAPVANSTTYDMKAYFFPDAGVEVRHRNNLDEVIYTYLGADGRSYIGKNTQWEQGWTQFRNGVEYLMRGFDISNYLNPQAHTVYALFDEQYRGPNTPLGDDWSLRFMPVMVPYFRHAWVQVFQRGTLTPIADGSGWDDTWIRIKEHLPTFTTTYGRVFEDVLAVQYSHFQDFRDTNEVYYVAKGHGYVEWTDGKLHMGALRETNVRLPDAPIVLGWWKFDKIKQPVGAPVNPPTSTPRGEPTTQPQQLRLRAGGAVNVRFNPNTGSSVLGTIPGGSLVVVKYPAEQVSANGYNWVWCSFGSLAGWVAITAAPMFLSASETRISNAVYASQWQPSARTGLCGPTSAFMVIMGDLVKVGLKAPAEFSVDHVADWMGLGKNSFSSLQQNVDALLAYGVKARSTEVTIPVIEAEIKAGRPVICLGKYGNLPTRRDVGFGGGHILVAIGFDAENIIVNDPDYTGSAGSGVYYPRADFARFLGEVGGTGNAPNRGILITGGRYDATD